MNQLEAFRETVEVYRQWNSAPRRVFIPANCDLAHMEDMLRRLEAEPDKFSDSKLGRWLGWAQGVLCVLGVLTLDQAKEINRMWAD